MDADTLTRLVGQELAAVGREHLAQARISELDADDGGASALAHDPDHGELDVWVGVVDGELTGECDCPADEAEMLCGHAVAVAFAALDKGIAFSSISGRERMDTEQRWYAEVAGKLDQAELVGLVAQQAGADRRFAALLLSVAGELTAPAEAELTIARESLAELTALLELDDPDAYELLKAGQQLLGELELLAIRPVTAELAELLGESTDAADALAEGLADVGEVYAMDAAELAETIAELHDRVNEEVVIV
jgi:hypothetical protein